MLVPAPWFVPELLGSGDALRSSDRAQIPNPGQPALADVPFLASLEEAAGLPLWPLWIGVAVLLAAAVRARRATPALLPAAAGAAWLAIVALMAEAGYSGEARYAVPGAAMLAISGAVGLAPLAGRHALAAAAVVAAVAAAALPRLDDADAIRREQAHQQALADQLATVLSAAGGREAVLACGRPYVGRLRGPADGLPDGRGEAPRRARPPAARARHGLPLAPAPGRPGPAGGGAGRLRRGRAHAGVAGPRGL